MGGQEEQDKQAQALETFSGSVLLAKLAPIVILVLMVLGGIYGGVFTPTEAGAVGALGALIIAAAKRTLTGSVLWDVLVEAGHIVASILLLIVAATMYSRMLGISGLPNELCEVIAAAEIGLYGILAIYVVVLIILGTILDTTSIILIMVPLFLPIVTPYDVSLIWFGIITIVGAEIGLLTPPLGISCLLYTSPSPRDS